MNTEWSLDRLYLSYTDPAFEKDFSALEDTIAAFKAYMAQPREGQDRLNDLKAMIEYAEQLTRLSTLLGSYIMLRQATDTTDPATAAVMGRLEQLCSSYSGELAMMQKYIGSLENLDELIAQDEKLAAYSFMLHETAGQAQYVLSDEAEEVIALMNLSGGSAWEMLQQYASSTVEAEYDGGTLNLSAVRNLAYDAQPAVRKAAYEAELKCYEKIKDSIAFALNSLKLQVSSLCKLRGYASPLEMTLKNTRMQRATLDALFTAIDEYLPKFHAYLRRKGELLGHKNGLPWYDLFAPMGKSSAAFTPESARDYLVSHFRGFAPDLAEMVQRAFDEAWIDFYPRAGKVGGAFCDSVPFIGQSFILTNFDGTFGSVVTLAHELGHAYHGQQMLDHLPLNGDYCMQVAETASTFNEAIIMNSAIAEAQGEEKLMLLESSLQDAAQIICDIYSRYIFESEVFRKRPDGFMFADELCEMMLEAQKKAYGDGLDHSALHPYMWACKSHYYSSQLSFYNFPYAFGDLFARGLYALYLKEGESFLPRYRALLHATSVSTVEEVAALAGIDITQPDFWRSSLEITAARIDEFLRLTK